MGNMKITANWICVSCTADRGEIYRGWTSTKQNISCTPQGERL